MTGVLALSSATVATVVVMAVMLLFAVSLIVSFIRATKADSISRQTATEDSISAEAAAAVEVVEEGMTRRDFFRVAWLSSLGLFALQFGGATIAYLWPNLKGGFGSKITVGTVADIKAAIAAANGPFYYGAGRFYIVPYEAKGIDDATDTNYASEGVLAEGLMPLYQRCVHLGCRVPFCTGSQWFECPCHGSKYNEAGEFQAGPAPRGMDRFKIEVGSDGMVSVDTSTIIQGPPRGTATVDQPPSGPLGGC
jgi:cytochrome b6-f complex iron-sulfur subunit